MIRTVTARLAQLSRARLRLRAVPATVLVAAFCLFLAGYFVRVAYEVNGDGRLAVTYALVDRGTLAIDAYVATEPDLLIDAFEHEGHYYTARPPFPSAVLVPVYATLRLVAGPASMEDIWWRWLLTLVLSGTSLVAVVLLAWRLQRDLGLPHAASPIAALVIATATPLVVYASLGLSHMFSAALMLGVLYCAIRAPRHGIVGGALFGGLVATEVMAALGAAVPFAWGLWTGSRAVGIRGFVAPLAGAAATSLVLPAYFLFTLGSPFADMYANLVEAEYRAAWTAGMVGLPRMDILLALLFSPGRGLFVFAPVAVIGMWRLMWSWRHRPAARPAVALSAAASLTVLLAIAGYAYWHGGASYGPRYLVPVLPLLCWSLATLPRRTVALLGLVASPPHLFALASHIPLRSPEFLFPYADYLTSANTPTVFGSALGWGAVTAIVPFAAVAALYVSAARRPKPDPA